MQKTLIVFSALLCIALGAVVFPPAPCPVLNCAGVGGACAPTATSPCTVCATNGQICQANAGSNATALCACYSTFQSCTANLGTICGLTVYNGFLQCLQAGLSCCGTAPTTVQVIECHRPTTFCNGTSGNCEAVKKTGFCDANIECGDPSHDVLSILPNPYACITQSCTYTPDFPPGAPCVANSDCFSQICTGGLCVGTAIGGNCITSLDCVAGSFCGSQSTCTAVFAVGASCSSAPISETGSACAFGSICDAGTCVAFASKANGASCITDEECVLGNVCFQGTCTTPATTLTCTSDSDCTGSKYEGECACNPVTGHDECTPATDPDLDSACASSATTLNNCVKSKGCDERLVGINCCNNEFNCLINCEFNALGDTKLVCGNVPTCAGTTKSAAVAIQVSFFLAVIAVVLALIF